MLSKEKGHTHITNLLRGAGSEEYETIQWQVDEVGFRQYYTNDPKYLRKWFVHVIADSHQSPMNVVETSVNRISGHRGASFGIVFCYQDLDNDNYGSGITLSDNDLDCDNASTPNTSSITGDCNDGNASINPGSSEVIGDAVDQNCDGFDDCYCGEVAYKLSDDTFLIFGFYG